MRVILHIGLHKTASTFLQWEVFSSFCRVESCVLYNPKLLLESLAKIDCLAKKYNGKIPEDEKTRCIIESREIITQIITDKKYSNKKILFISWESLSQNLFLLNFEENFSIIRDIFKNCEIIVFLRYQPDWILSVYKQLIHGNQLISIKDFLNFRDGDFKPSINSNVPNIDINKINYSKLLQNYIDTYGRKNVHIYFYEFLNKETVASIFEIFQAEMPLNINFTKPVNRGYSALAIQLTFLKDRVCRFLKISHKKDCDRQPLAMFNISWGAAREQNSFLFLFPLFFYKLYWNLLRAPRSPWGSWRGFIQKVFDRLIYIDWDLLKGAGLKNLLESKFNRDNKKLLNFMEIEKIPKKYFE